MSNMYFECHITMEGDPAKLKELVEMTDWKFSAIDGDITLGGGLKCYATKHFPGRSGTKEILLALHDCAAFLAQKGATVLRQKAEIVIYDDRTDKIKPCTGGCVSCHLEDLKT